MPLSPGTRLGTYEVVALLGSGGMGEVHRAKDIKLGRDVALKILPDSFTHDGERVARFRREAQLLASLNHPNIGAIYGLEEVNACQFLVLELVEGETLAARIAKDPLQLDEALTIATQIAEALEAAHEKGIIHRDLKPANIALTAAGNVKVLDFGLAKTTGASLDLANSPTVTSPAMMTGVGIILGTAAYMSPEQAKGHPADSRSDVWAFGCVLYEMLTGRRAFRGHTVPETLAAVLMREPDVAALPPNLNPRLVTLLTRCLEKNPKRRWQAVGDLRAELEIIAAAPRVVAVDAPVVGPTRRPWRRTMQLGAALVAGALLAMTVWTLARKPSTPPAITRFSLVLVEREQGSASPDIAVSRDGTQIVYVANQRLYLRRLSEFATTPIAGTETQVDLSDPVFSPDGRSVAFWSGTPRPGALKRIAVTGGVAVTICQAAMLSGMSWGSDGIVFGQAGKGIMRVSPNGGKPESLLSVKEGEVALGPQMLPGGEAVLFTLGRTGRAATPDLSDRSPNRHVIDDWNQAHIVAQSLKTGERKTLIEGGFDVRYLQTGHLVYALGGALLAVPFDLQRKEVTGGPIPVVEDIRRSFSMEAASAHFDVSETGSLIYVGGPSSKLFSQWDLAFFDRDGGVEPMRLRPGYYESPRMSPDGKRVVFGTEEDVWVYEVSGNKSPLRITYGGRNRFPIWSPDGQHVTFQSDREHDQAVFWQRADGSGTAERLTSPDPGTSHVPESWSPNGGLLLFNVARGSTSSLWTFSLHDKKSSPFGGVQSESGTLGAATFSPDGRWVAYAAGLRIFVQPFPATGAVYQISADFARSPRWSPAGNELFYFQNNELVSVSVATLPKFTFGNPSPALKEGRFEGRLLTDRNYDVTTDGKRLVGVIAPAGQPNSGSYIAQIQVVLNWFDELKAHVPAR